MLFWYVFTMIRVVIGPLTVTVVVVVVDDVDVDCC
jgi:hypothetical protein